jgi:hypothetical protein
MHPPRTTLFAFDSKRKKTNPMEEEEEEEEVRSDAELSYPLSACQTLRETWKFLFVTS